MNPDQITTDTKDGREHRGRRAGAVLDLLARAEKARLFPKVKTTDRVELAPMSPTQLRILAALQGKPAGAVYRGTVPAATKAKRRAAGKRARAARRANR